MAVAGCIDAVGSRVIPSRNIAGWPNGRRRLRGIEPAGERFRLEIERRLHEARVDAAAYAGALAAKERGNDAHREQGCAMVVGDRYADRTWTGFFLPGDRHDAEQRL